MCPQTIANVHYLQSRKQSVDKTDLGNGGAPVQTEIIFLMKLNDHGLQVSNFYYFVEKFNNTT